MATIGYGRVSTKDQDLTVQIEQLTAEGCDRIFSEKRSGSTTDSREELAAALAAVGPGDVFVVCRLDRLARSTADLLRIVSQLEKKQVGFRCIHQAIDTTTSMGKMFLTILGAIGEFELNLRKERQREGIDKAMGEGKYRGRPKAVDEGRIRELAAEGKGASEIARLVGRSVSSVYRAAPGMFTGEGPKRAPGKTWSEAKKEAGL